MTDLQRTTPAPHAGRLFNEADAVEGAQGVVLLSHSAWVTWFGADEGIVGAPVELNAEPHIVIGVLTEGFEFEDADFCTPLVVETPQLRGIATAADPLTFTAVTALLLAVALVACWLPAKQATRIAPMDVLKGT